MQRVKSKNKKGFKQGCILSPLLFNIYLDHILCETINQKNGISLSPLYNRKLADVDYADDICLMSSMKNILRGC